MPLRARRGVETGKGRAEVWNWFLHHRQLPTQPSVETREVERETSRDSWEPKLRGCVSSFPCGKVGAGRPLTECPQQHKTAAGEKKQWCGELRQWPPV